MRRLMKRALVGLACVIALGASVGAIYEMRSTTRDLAATPAPGVLVDVGGYRLHLWCTGSGEPTVVLDAGLGGTSFDWGYVQPAVAPFARACSYDRAGMGYSDAGPGPRTAQQIATELTALLDKSEIRRPAILVGASVGAWNVRMFASAHEDRVAGLVLIDPRHEQQGPRLVAAGDRETPPWIEWVTRLAPVLGHLGIARVAGLAPGPSPSVLSPAVRGFAQATRFRAASLVAASSELRNAQESAEQVARSRRVLDAPLVVVSAGQRQSTRIGTVLEELQRDHLQLSTRSCRIVAAGAGHAVAFQQPDVVVDAIRTVVAASRTDSAPDCRPPGR
jgi:pimeloyl-ACP methyl ester carboxylesterase